VVSDILIKSTKVLLQMRNRCVEAVLFQCGLFVWLELGLLEGNYTC